MTQSVSPYCGSELAVHPPELMPPRPSVPSRTAVASGYNSFPEILCIRLASLRRAVRHGMGSAATTHGPFGMWVTTTVVFRPAVTFTSIEQRRSIGSEGMWLP